MKKIKIDLSVVILSFNTKELLKQALKSIFQSRSNGLTFEVIVVDNNSSDQSTEMVKNEFPETILIESDKNLGFSGGNNLAIKKARGRYFLFLNSDTRVRPQALLEMVNFMDGDKKFGASTPKTILVSGGMDPDCHRGFPSPWASITYFLGLERLFPKSKLFGRYHQFYLDLDSIHEIDAGFGTFMIVRKEVVDQIGGWDEKYFFYGEDLDYFYRIKKAGWKVMFYPQPLVFHHKGASSGLRKESREITRASQETRIKTAKASVRAMEIFYKKFYQNIYPSFITFLIISGIKIKGFFRITSHYLKK